MSLNNGTRTHWERWQFVNLLNIIANGKWINQYYIVCHSIDCEWRYVLDSLVFARHTIWKLILVFAIVQSGCGIWKMYLQVGTHLMTLNRTICLYLVIRCVWACETWITWKLPKPKKYEKTTWKIYNDRIDFICSVKVSFWMVCVHELMSVGWLVG